MWPGHILEATGYLVNNSVLPFGLTHNRRVKELISCGMSPALMGDDQQRDLLLKEPKRTGLHSLQGSEDH